MKRLAPALAFVLIAACSGKAKQGTQPPTGSGSATPVLAKRVIVSWGIEQQGESANIFLQTTDETGKQVSHPVGTFAGTCSKVLPTAEMKAVIACDCKTGTTGTQLQAVVQDPDVIVLELRIDDGVTPDPMAREEVMRVKVPLGAAVTGSGG